jgi:tetratricopeptide (TPR) repeat protein
MTALRRTPNPGRALAAAVLLVLAGCHQFPSLIRNRSVRDGNHQPDGSITPAQEADVQISMGRVAEKQGNLDQAMGAYRAALTRDRSRADAYLRMAVLHDKQGKFRESADLYRKALALRPGDPDVYCDMGYSYYLQRRWAESEMNLRQAIAVDRDHRRAHNNLALLLAHDSRLDDALAEFGRAGSNPAESHMNLGFVLTMERRWELAQAEYQRALALDPSSQLAKDRLGQLNTLVAKIDKPRDGAPKDSGLVTTSAGVSPFRGELSTATGTTASISQLADPVRPPAALDPGLIMTASNVNPPERYQTSRFPVPSLPVDNASPRDFWAGVDSGPNATTGRQPGPPRVSPPVSLEQPNSRPRPDTAASRGPSHGPLLAINASKPAPSDRGSPNRPKIPRPRPPQAAATGRPGKTQSISSTPTSRSLPSQARVPAEPRPTTAPPTPRSPIPPPIKSHNLKQDTDTSRNPPDPGVRPL